MKLIDSHCHLDLPAFNEDRTQVLANCRAAGVMGIVVPGIRAADWPGLLRLCRQSRGTDGGPALYPALGLHPLFVEQHTAADLQDLTMTIAEQRPVAIGEIGLDFYHSEPDRERQLQLFDTQLGVAYDAGLPVLLHVRKAHDETLKLLRKVRLPRGGICHAFNGSLQQAQQYIALGFKLGFGGVLTYDRSHRLHRLARELPLDSIVLETDAPDMAPASHHGQRNSPEYLPELLQTLARLREEDADTIATQTTANAIDLLELT